MWTVLSIDKALSLLGVVTSVTAAIFLSRAASRPKREELHALGQGTILGGSVTNHLFGIRTALVQGAVVQWVSHVVGVVLLCLGIASQMVALAFDGSQWYLPTLPCILLAVAVGLSAWPIGDALIRTLSARAVMSSIRSEVRFWRTRGPTAVAQLTGDKTRDEMVIHIGRLLAGLVSAERARQFAQSLLDDLDDACGAGE